MGEPLVPAVLGGLPFALTLDPREGLERGLVRELRAAMQDGRLPGGSRLPGSRALASELGVARGVVVGAYATLHAEGYLEARPGSGTRVAAGLGRRPAPPGQVPGWVPALAPAPVDPPTPPGVRIDFRLGRPTLSGLDRRSWRRAWAAAAATPPADYTDPLGEPGLRAALAAHLTRQRGLPTDASALVVTAGTQQGLGLVARALLRPGDPVIFENPGYRSARAIFEDAGAALVPVPVDQGGLVTADLPAARLAYVTPSHQYPLGVCLSAARRLELLAWARRHDALIIEDDYDSDFRHGAPPLPTLASLEEPGEGRVLYLGTLSKVLTPALRLGYLRCPPALLPWLERQTLLTDRGLAWPLQQAVTALLTSGDLERHIRRGRRHYARLSARLEAALAPLGAAVRVRAPAAGLHVCLYLAPGLDARVVAQHCLERGVRVSTLDSYVITGPVPQALLLGYGGLTLGETDEGAAVIVAVISGMMGA